MFCREIFNMLNISLQNIFITVHKQPYLINTVIINPIVTGIAKFRKTNPKHFFLLSAVFSSLKHLSFPLK